MNSLIVKTLISFSTFFLFTKKAISQSGATTIDPGFFRDPLGIPIQLSANFGELRPNHFHMGLDIRTESRENLPVYAAADGYISRIKIERGGFGNALYITHPNGFTTLYAHLNAFTKEVSHYILQKQYAEKSWAQDAILPPGLFPVKKGAFIAYSGNTGASAGPHLHFEIRNTETGKNYNPELFGFSIPDSRRPEITALYMYDRRYPTSFQNPQWLSISGEPGKYTTKEKVITVHSPLVSFAIHAKDKSSNSPFNHGIFEGSMQLDEQPAFSFKMDSISYNETRYVNASIDYRVYEKQKKYIQYLFQLPGNNLGIFSKKGQQGLIILTDTLQHHIEITVKDIRGNTSTLYFTIQLGTLTDKTMPLPGPSIPIIPGQEKIARGKYFTATFSSKAFYESFPFIFKEAEDARPNSISAIIELSDYTIPVHDEYTIALQTSLVENDPMKKFVVMQLVSRKSKSYKKGTWAGNRLQASFRDLGIINLVIDSLSPTITPVSWKNEQAFSTQKSLSFRVSDQLSGVANVTAYIDGHWILLAQRNGLFTYTFDDYCPQGTHTLVCTATDIAGNETSSTFTFTKN